VRAAKQPERALLHEQAWYTLAHVPGRAAAQAARKLPRVLFLTHSAGFVHDVVKRPDPFVLSLAEEKFTEMAKGSFEVECTQDCAAISAKNLARFDAVMFYTTGELPIPAAQRAELMDWIAAGHAFAGIHCATDTLYEFAPYQAMIGGAFDGHPWHEKVGVRVLDPDTLATGAPARALRDHRRDLPVQELRARAAAPAAGARQRLDRRHEGQPRRGRLYANAWMREWASAASSTPRSATGPKSGRTSASGSTSSAACRGRSRPGRARAGARRRAGALRRPLARELVPARRRSKRNAAGAAEWTLSENFVECNPARATSARARSSARAGSARRVPGPRGGRLALRPGPRQQRRLRARPLRGAGARLLRPEERRAATAARIYGKSAPSVNALPQAKRGRATTSASMRRSSARTGRRRRARASRSGRTAS
jgi:hypothetical protein